MPNGGRPPQGESMGLPLQAEFIESRERDYTGSHTYTFWEGQGSPTKVCRWKFVAVGEMKQTDP